MEMTKKFKRKKQFKDTKLAAFIRNRIYSYWRFKRKYREVLEISKHIALLMVMILLIFAVSGIFGMSIYRWVWLGEY